MSQVLSPWGYLPDGWNLSTIDEEKTALFDYVANGSFASLAENVKYRETPDYAVLIRLVDYNNNFSGDFVYIDEHAYNFLSKSKLYGDEIIISNVGANVGTVFKAPRLNKKMSLAPNAICVKFKGCNDFYYYWLRSRIGQHIINSLVSGSAQPKFNKTHFRSMPIPVPPIEIQENIASILSSLDDKIAVNRRICENLEAQAQALFKHWFIDFAPFKNGKFVESELGMIPEGWRVGSLGEICNYSNKKIAVSQLTNTSYYSTENMLPNKAGAMKASSLPQVEMTTGCLPYDVLVSNIRPYFKKIIRVETTCGCSTDVLCFHPVDTKYMSYMYRVLYDDSFFAYVMAGSKGTKMPRGDKQQIMKYPIVIPTNFVLEKYSNLVEPMFELISSSNKEIIILSTLRDTLLPKLMSGKIKV